MCRGTYRAVKVDGAMHLCFELHFVNRFDSSLLIPAKLCHEFAENFGLLFLRHMAAIRQHDEARMEDRVMQRVTVADRHDLILLTPNDQGLSIDQARIPFDAVGVPIAGRFQYGMMCVSS